jgi:AAA domain
VLLAADSQDVVVVAGLPGAGKTTLVAFEPRALDSDAMREAWAPRLTRVPYLLWRPVVHARHWVAIWRALKRSDGVVVVRPFTSAWLRRGVLRRARRHHPAVHLVVVDATRAQARQGQRARGRTIGRRAMRRHERRWARADLANEPWTTVSRLRRHDFDWTSARFDRGKAESHSRAHLGVGEPDPAPVRLHDRAADCQAEPGGARRPGLAVAAAVERLEGAAAVGRV